MVEHRSKRTFKNIHQSRIECDQYGENYQSERHRKRQKDPSDIRRHPSTIANVTNMKSQQSHMEYDGKYRSKGWESFIQRILQWQPPPVIETHGLNSYKSDLSDGVGIYSNRTMDISFWGFTPMNKVTGKSLSLNGQSEQKRSSPSESLGLLKTMIPVQ